MGGIFYFGESGFNPIGKAAAFASQAQASSGFVEQGDSQLFLKGANLVADGAVRLVARVGGALNTAVAGDRSKSTQGVE